MSNSSESTEQLIAKARTGDVVAVDHLRKQFDTTLRTAIEGENQQLKSHVAQTLNAALVKTWQRIPEFQGDTADQLEAWLLTMVRQQLGNSQETVAPAPDNLETIAPVSPDLETIAPSPASAERPSFDESQTVVENAVEPESDEQETVAPRAETSSDGGAKEPPPTNGGLDTIPPDDNTRGNDPLATITDTAPQRPAKEPVLEVFGDYEIISTIAKGGMGVVYKARHSKLKRTVALKMILSGKSANQADIERFYIEAEAAAQLEHKNIVGIHEVGEVDGQHYISMQFVEGQSLDDLIGAKLLPPKVAASYMAILSEAMQYAHEKGVLHRDLKPANILVDRKGVPLVTDFGLAKLESEFSEEEGEGRDSKSRKTMMGAPMGTPSYMPPEQAQGKLDEISELSDVYSLGATLYDLLTGKPPFSAADIWETMEQVKKAEPVAPRVLNASVPKDLETICLKCLQKSPARRYQSAQELADELRRYLAGEPIHARPVGIVERSYRWCWRNPWPTAAIAASVSGLILATVLWQSAVSARNEAEASRLQLLGAINELFTAWGNNKLLNEPALYDVRKDLLDSATKLYKNISDHLAGDAELQKELGVSYYRLGTLMFEMRAHEDADRAFASALSIQQQGQLNDATDQKRLGDTLILGGNINVARGGGLNNLKLADNYYNLAISARKRLVQIAPAELKDEYSRQLLEAEMNLGTVLQRIGDVHDNNSQLHDRNAAEATDPQIQEKEKRLADREFALADQQYRAAQKQFLTVNAARTALLATLPKDSSVRSELMHDTAQGCYNLALITKMLEQYDDAKLHIEQGMALFSELYVAGNVQHRLDRARCQQLAGTVAADRALHLQRTAESLAEVEAEVESYYLDALQHYGKAQADLEWLDRNSLAIVTSHGVALGGLHVRVGNLHFDMGRLGAARASYDQAMTVLVPLIKENPGLVRAKNYLADAKFGIADLDAIEAEQASAEDEASIPCPQ